MKEIKYIYFEINHIAGINPTPKIIENENALLIKPHTNSSGIWGFTNMTEYRGLSEPAFSIVNQYWIDLEKFREKEHKVYDELKEQVDTVLERLNQKLLKK